MPARIRRKDHAVNRRAAFLAALLHPTIPAASETLCRDLGVDRHTLQKTVYSLTERGVHARLTSEGWLVDRDTWDACKKLGERSRD